MRGLDTLQGDLLCWRALLCPFRRPGPSKWVMGLHLWIWRTNRPIEMRCAIAKTCGEMAIAQWRTARLPLMWCCRRRRRKRHRVARNGRGRRRTSAPLQAAVSGSPLPRSLLAVGWSTRGAPPPPPRRCPSHREEAGGCWGVSGTAPGRHPHGVSPPPPTVRVDRRNQSRVPGRAPERMEVRPRGPPHSRRPVTIASRAVAPPPVAADGAAAHGRGGGGADGPPHRLRAVHPVVARAATAATRRGRCAGRAGGGWGGHVPPSPTPRTGRWPADAADRGCAADSRRKGCCSARHGWRATRAPAVGFLPSGAHFAPAGGGTGLGGERAGGAGPPPSCGAPTSCPRQPATDRARPLRACPLGGAPSTAASRPLARGGQRAGPCDLVCEARGRGGGGTRPPAAARCGAIRVAAAARGGAPGGGLGAPGGGLGAPAAAPCVRRINRNGSARGARVQPSHKMQPRCCVRSCLVRTAQPSKRPPASPSSPPSHHIPDPRPPWRASSCSPPWSLRWPLSAR